MKKGETTKMTVTMTVTSAQALALIAMFDYWTKLGKIGSSRYVGFMVDGDGDFHPNCTYDFENSDFPSLTDDLRKKAVVEDKDGNRKYDYDAIAWEIYHPNTIETK